MKKQFNIRVYGLLTNTLGDVLLSDENRFGRSFTKFPGGGLEWGEGMKECLVREFQEELNLEIEVGELFYCTDFFQQSAFNENDQLISLYYWVKPKHKAFGSDLPVTLPEAEEQPRWKPLESISEKDLTFPVDKIVAQKLSELH